MPADDSRLLDIRTSPVQQRIEAAADFVEAGYEVHFNFSPVVIRPGWEDAWAQLLRTMDDVLPRSVKDQAAAEVIMLTHNRDLHDVNMAWHPSAEDAIWRPELQQAKRSENGSLNVRYRNAVKAEAVETVRTIAIASMRRPGPAIRSSSEARRRSKASMSSISELLPETRHEAVKTRAGARRADPEGGRQLGGVEADRVHEGRIGRLPVREAVVGALQRP